MVAKSSVRRSNRTTKYVGHSLCLDHQPGGLGTLDPSVSGGASTVRIAARSICFASWKPSAGSPEYDCFSAASGSTILVQRMVKQATTACAEGTTSFGMIGNNPSPAIIPPSRFQRGFFESSRSTDIKQRCQSALLLRMGTSLIAVDVRDVAQRQDLCDCLD